MTEEHDVAEEAEAVALIGPDGTGHTPDVHLATDRPLALVTGASSGIGLALAEELAERGYDLLVVAEDDELEPAADSLRSRGAAVEALRLDLSSRSGVQELVGVASAHVPDAVLVNAGVGVNGPFLETALEDHIDLISLNVTGAVHLLHEVLPGMVDRGSGQVLVTSSVAAKMPGPWMSTYSASKAFLLSFAQALRQELSDTGVTVTALMPGPTDTEFFERADMEDTKLGQADKDDPADVAREGVEAMLAGDDHVVAGSFKNRIQAGLGAVLPDAAVAKGHEPMSRPGSGD
ncbi:MAG TPA: SDR family NAD(P)-dependent oxidoreductase [Acidimicrobiales bacterium]|nr:SDR family NAD(P)-dependent oxidoreductase [Acidimicrobiales bacterium]